jgi:hypothetical protein
MVDYRPRTTMRKSIDALRAGSTVPLAAVAHDTAVEQHNGFTFTSGHSPQQSGRGTRGRMLAASDRSRPLQKIADGRVVHHRPRDVADGRWSDGRVPDAALVPSGNQQHDLPLRPLRLGATDRPTYASPKSTCCPGGRQQLKRRFRSVEGTSSSLQSEAVPAALERAACAV